MVATVVYGQLMVLPFAFVFSRFCENFHWARRFHKWFLSFQWRIDGTNTKYILKSPFKSVFLWYTAISQQAHHLNNVYTSEIIVTAEERASAELKRFVQRILLQLIDANSVRSSLKIAITYGQYFTFATNFDAKHLHSLSVKLLDVMVFSLPSEKVTPLLS